MRLFFCHRSDDSSFVIEVARQLQSCATDIFYYEDHQHEDEDPATGRPFSERINKAIHACDAMVVFVGETFAEGNGWCLEEVQAAHARRKSFVVVRLAAQDGGAAEIPVEVFAQLNERARIDAPDETSASELAVRIAQSLRLRWRGPDGLPADPHLFNYEKDIIRFYQDLGAFGERLFDEQEDPEAEKRARKIRTKILRGAPPRWPRVRRWGGGWYANQLVGPKGIGLPRDPGAEVRTAALGTYLAPSEAAGDSVEELSFPEAGPRARLHFPRPEQNLTVRILVSGGIAPGVNAVIDGIVHRHWEYARAHGREEGLDLRGIPHGFTELGMGGVDSAWLAGGAGDYLAQAPRLEVARHVSTGGSVLGTSRVDELLDPERRSGRLDNIVQALDHVDILYVIGGDGSMKAAHALWHLAQARYEAGGRRKKLSIVAIPKTMDNDVLWVWQSFGFLSAVEKAREVIEALSTEVNSNPRVCVVQLFGSESGFVVSHAVLAGPSGTCWLALIPENPFSMEKIAEYLKGRMWKERQRTPRALIVLAETAIPTDAWKYAGKGPGDDPEIDVDLSEKEREAIWEFQSQGRRFQGQTNDHLRNAGLKIVKGGLEKLLPEIQITNPPRHAPPRWKSRLRVFTNEPRHLLRAIPPSASDMIFGQRLGVLAVDNAMAGYTDFMISQWLTEYVLVPLDLVVLGRKRIPRDGIFWKSVLAKTGQPADLT